MTVLRHALGVKLALELDRPDVAATELDALLDALVVVEQITQPSTRKAHR